MPHLTPRPSSTILFEGDSLTGFRVGPTLDTWAWARLTGAHHGYPERVGEWVFCHRPDLRLAVRNGAIGGSTVGDLLERFDRNVAALKPGIVVFTIGTNDCARAVPLADVASGIAEYGRRLRSVCDGRLLFIGGFTRIPGVGEGSVFARPELAGYMSAVADAVTVAGGLAVDAGGVLGRKAAELERQWAGHTLFHDGTHFGPVGHEILAGIVLRALGLLDLPGDPAA